MSDPGRIGVRVPRGVLLGAAQAVGRTGAFCSRPGATLSAVPDSLPAQPAAVSSRSWERHGLGCVCPPVSCMPPPGSRGGRRWLRGGASSGPLHSAGTGRFRGPLHSAGTGRSPGAPHSAPVRRWPSRCIRGAVARPGERSANRGAPGAFRRAVLLGAASVVVGVVLGAVVRRLRPQPALAASGRSVWLGALLDPWRVSQCLRLKRVARRPAPTMASPITRSWYSRMRLPSIPLVVVRIMPGGVALGGRGGLGAVGLCVVLNARTARCAGVRGHCTRRVLAAPLRMWAARCGHPSSVLLGGPGLLLGDVRPAVARISMDARRRVRARRR